MREVIFLGIKEEVMEQIVGTLHQDVLIECASHYLRLVDFQDKQIIENHMIGL